MITMPVTHTLPDGTKLALSTDKLSEGVLYGPGIVLGIWVYVAKGIPLEEASTSSGTVRVTSQMISSGRDQLSAYKSFQGGRP